MTSIDKYKSVPALVGLVWLLFLPGCKPTGTTTYETVEFSEHPEAIVSGRIPPDRATLYGVKLGDADSQLPPSDVEHRGDAVWHRRKDGHAAYQTAEGKVIAMKLADADALDKLNIGSLDALRARFGKADAVDAAENLSTHHYAKKHLDVVWDTAAGRVVALILFP